MPNETNEATGLAGFRWPAEWEPHTATWIAWPHNHATWPGRFNCIPNAFAQFVLALAKFETVNVLAQRGAVAQQAQQLVGHHAGVVLHDIATNDAWIRDYGPMFLLGPDRQLIGVDWRFNSWGGKYPPWDQDDAATRRICDSICVSRHAQDFVLEGGSVDTNGEGTILTTASCLLDPRRNGEIDQQAATRKLMQVTGARHVIWLHGEPLTGDDTDGHVDQVARFVGPRRVVVAVERDPNSVNYRPLLQNMEQLEAYRDPDGHSLEVIPIPLPQPFGFDGQCVPASYCNFYIANGCVIVPQFEDPADQVACGVLASVFPDRDVIGLPARDIVWGLGAFHCLTQQQPRA